MPKITCCYKCTDRVLGCHASCERYIAELEANKKQFEQIQKARQKDSQNDNYEISRNAKIQRYRRGKR